MIVGLMAGFECATQLRPNGRRHDFVAATRHDVLAEMDYALVRQSGFMAARDGLRWHLIERRPGRYRWDSFDAQHDAARLHQVPVVWDLLHYGWPRWLDPTKLDFVARFAEFAGEAAVRIGPGGHYTPINEISFMAWGGGEVAYLAPFRRDCADELKRNFCRAAIAAARAIRQADPLATIYTSEPLIHVTPAHDTADHRVRARHLIAAQHEATSMMLGETDPELGGSADLVDVIGVNYYPHNQFDSARHLLAIDDPRRRTLADMLIDAQHLYRKPLILSETGAEGEARVPWLARTCAEVRAANARGADVRAICLYPILNHLGWDDDRYCDHGLFCGVADERLVYQPLAEQIAIELQTPLDARELIAVQPA